jgi:hypothetical protein
MAGHGSLVGIKVSITFFRLDPHPHHLVQAGFGDGFRNWQHIPAEPLLLNSIGFYNYKDDGVHACLFFNTC